MTCSKRPLPSTKFRRARRWIVLRRFKLPPKAYRRAVYHHCSRSDKRPPLAQQLRSLRWAQSGPHGGRRPSISTATPFSFVPALIFRILFWQLLIVIRWVVITLARVHQKARSTLGTTSPPLAWHPSCLHSNPPSSTTLWLDSRVPSRRPPSSLPSLSCHRLARYPGHWENPYRHDHDFPQPFVVLALAVSPTFRTSRCKS